MSPSNGARAPCISIACEANGSAIEKVQAPMPRGERTSHAAIGLEDHAAMDAVDQYFGQMPSIELAGKKMTPAELKTVFKANQAARWAVDETRAKLKGDILAARKASARRHEIRLALRKYILATFGPGAAQILSAFHFSMPKKTGPKTVEAKRSGATKAKATRAARHTMGKKQKKAIKGSPTAETKKA